MNWLLIIVILIIAWNIAIGYNRGFLRIIYSLLAWVLVVGISTAATPYVKEVLQQNTDIEAKIEQNVKDSLKEKVESESNIQKEQLKSNVDDSLQQSQEYQILQQLEIELPQPAIDKLFDSSADTAGEMIEQSGIYDGIASQIASMAMDGIAYVITFILVGIVCTILSQALKIIERIPIISGINKWFGIAAGTLKGFVIVWIFMAIAAMSCTSGFGKSMISYIYESPFLKFIYENNLILKLIMLFV